MKSHEMLWNSLNYVINDTYSVVELHNAATISNIIIYVINNVITNVVYKILT